MRYVFLFFIFAGCSHYSSILPHYHSGNRHPEKLTLSSCSNYVLGFSTKEENISYANALDSFGLVPDQVFSVDERTWLGTWPIYYWKCIDINVNSTFQSIQANERDFSATAQAPMIKPVRVPKPGDVTGDFKKDLELCSKLKPTEAKVCRKMMNRQYESLQKVN